MSMNGIVQCVCVCVYARVAYIRLHTCISMYHRHPVTDINQRRCDIQCTYYLVLYLLHSNHFNDFLQHSFYFTLARLSGSTV